MTVATASCFSAFPFSAPPPPFFYSHFFPSESLFPDFSQAAAFFLLFPSKFFLPPPPPPVPTGLLADLHCLRFIPLTGARLRCAKPLLEVAETLQQIQACCSLWLTLHGVGASRPVGLWLQMPMSCRVAARSPPPLAGAFWRRCPIPCSSLGLWDEPEAAAVRQQPGRNGSGRRDGEEDKSGSRPGEGDGRPGMRGRQ